MIIGLTGSHRSGKSTLAKAVAEDLGLTFVPQSFGEAARRHGVDAVAPMTLTDRLHIQQRILIDHIDMVRSNQEVIIVDRTPIDYLAYLLGEFHMQSHMAADSRVFELVRIYKRQVIQAVDTFYDKLFVLQPLESYAAEPGKPAFNVAYQDHIQLLVEGAIVNLEGAVRIHWISNTDFEERRTAMTELIVKRLDEVHTLRRSSAHLH